MLRCNENNLLDDSGGFNVITGKAKWSEKRFKMLLSLKMEEGARNQGTQETSRS